MTRDESISVVVTERGGKPFVKLHGGMDILMVQDLTRAARAVVECSDDVSVCCEEVQYLDGAALQLLVALKHALALKGKKIEIVGISPEVERLFRWAGLMA